MLNRSMALVVCAAVVSLAPPARTQQRPSSDSEALRKFDGVLDFLRRRSAQDYAIAAPNGMDEAKYLKVGGIEQSVTLRGEDRANPVVLVLHGGRGDATNPWGHAAFRRRQWNQRGAGRTLGRNGRASASTLTIDRLGTRSSFSGTRSALSSAY